MKRTAEEAAETRGALIDAALVVFSERGYAASTLDEIAKKASVTRGAVYHHFADKAAIYVAAVKERWSDAFAPLLATLHARDEQTEPLARVRNFLERYCRALETDETMRWLLEITVLRTELVPELKGAIEAKRLAFGDWMTMLVDVLAEARHRGSLREDVSPRVAAAAVVAFANGLATTWLLAPNSFSPKRDAAALAGVLVDGLGGPETTNITSSAETRRAQVRGRRRARHRATRAR
jgi:TetR/AcrR family acrAB operon transcriptional repressor